MMNNLNKYEIVSNKELGKTNGGFNKLAHTLGRATLVGLTFVPFFF
ncbi:hypothetical protein [Companilactobacillus sp. HBUAS56275]